MEFYAAASQVIPVLLLALIFENRALLRKPDSYHPSERKDPSYWNATQIVGRVWVTLVIAAAEIAALVGLYRQEERQLTNGVVWLGLTVALGLLIWSVVGRQWGYAREWWASQAKRDLWFVVLATVLILTFTWSVLDFFV